MSKRYKFGQVSFILATGLWLTHFAALESRFGLILALSAVSYVLTAWVLFEDIKGIEWLSLMILPVMFVLGSGLFSYYLPMLVPDLAGWELSLDMARFLGSSLRLVYFVFVGLGIYAILLTENIFSVASVRTIQLIRAARSVGFIMTLLTGMFFFHAVFSLKLAFFLMGGIVAVLVFLLAFQGLWSVDLKTANMKDLYFLSSVAAFLMAQLAIALAFWPLKAFIGALMLTAGFYALLGLFQQRLANRLFLGNYLEYVVFSAIVIVVSFLTTSWRG